MHDAFGMALVPNARRQQAAALHYHRTPYDPCHCEERSDVAISRYAPQSNPLLRKSDRREL